MRLKALTVLAQAICATIVDVKAEVERPEPRYNMTPRYEREEEP